MVRYYSMNKSIIWIRKSFFYNDDDGDRKWTDILFLLLLAHAACHFVCLYLWENSRGYWNTQDIWMSIVDTPFTRLFSQNEIEEKVPMWARRSSMFWTLHWVMYIFEEWTRWECLNMPHIHDPHAHGLIRSNNSWIRPWYNWHTFHEQSFYFFKMCKSTLWLFYWVESFEWFVMKISCYEADQYLKINIVHPISAAHLPNIPVNFQQCQSIANAYVLNYQHLFGAKIGRI